MPREAQARLEKARSHSADASAVIEPAVEIQLDLETAPDIGEIEALWEIEAEINAAPQASQEGPRDTATPTTSPRPFKTKY